MRRIKPIILTLLLLTAVGSQFAVANEVAAIWTRLYERVRTLDQKQQIMLNIVEQHSRDMIPVLTEALDEEIRTFRNTANVTEKSKKNALMKMVVKELGRLKAGEAVPVVWETVETVEEPLLKGEAIIALGSMGGRQYADEMALMLRNINFNYDEIENQRKNEIIAYSLVMALGRFKSEVGYAPVFFASQGWYSGRSQVKDLAETVLQQMVDDPTDQLLTILRENNEYKVKLAALRAAEESAAPETGKAQVAAAALNEGLTYSPKNQAQKRQLKTIRLNALRMLKKYPQPENETLTDNMVQMLRLYRTDRVFAEDEMITLLETMGTYTGEEVARPLAELLAYYNERREFTSPDSYRIVTALIQAVGDIGHVAGLEELTIITISDYWEGAIQREAQAAIDRIKAQN
jgi:hypothetical protein